jgi:hypothetical protein
MSDIGTVAGLIEYLKTLPQDAAVYVADGESYRLQEDYPDWDQENNASFPLEFVEVVEGRSAEEQREAFLRQTKENNRRADERSLDYVKQGKGYTDPEGFVNSFPYRDDPALMVTLVGSR